VASRNQHKAQVDPEKLFLHGVSFHEAQIVLTEQTPDVHSVEARAMAAPACVLSAFACELFLKCLVCIERGYQPRGHDLLVLFNLLSAQTRERLREIWAHHAQTYQDKVQEFRAMHGFTFETELVAALKKGRRAFDLIRYRHEERREEFAFYLGALPYMLRNRAFELRPDWAEQAKKAWHERHGVPM
jgi:hypothetical protein